MSIETNAFLQHAQQLIKRMIQTNHEHVLLPTKTVNTDENTYHFTLQATLKPKNHDDDQPADHNQLKQHMEQDLQPIITFMEIEQHSSVCLANHDVTHQQTGNTYTVTIQATLKKTSDQQ